MARFTLVVRPDGKALLTSTDPITDREAHEIRAAVAEWTHVDGPDVLAIGEVDVVQVVDLELDLGTDAPVEVGA